MGPEGRELVAMVPAFPKPGQVARAAGA